MRCWQLSKPGYPTSGRPSWRPIHSHGARRPPALRTSPCPSYRRLRYSARPAWRPAPRSPQYPDRASSVCASVASDALFGVVEPNIRACERRRASSSSVALRRTDESAFCLRSNLRMVLPTNPSAPVIAAPSDGRPGGHRVQPGRGHWRSRARTAACRGGRICSQAAE